MLSLSLWAKKAGEVLASASSWSRVIREAGLKRSKVRVYPVRPKIGIRASAPFQILHIDVTILRLMDGSRAFIQCVIDNFSRYVLAHKVSRDYGGMRTKELLIHAIAKGKELGLTLTPNVLCDSGCENINADVDSLISEGQLSMTIAQIDIEFSNSMIEMLFYRLKHRYLFTFPLSNFETLEKGADFFFTESNTVIPHSALKGGTPEEIVMGKWNEEKVKELHDQIKMARELRSKTNLSLQCPICLT
jgi:transposase InsO family protein